MKRIYIFILTVLCTSLLMSQEKTSAELKQLREEKRSAENHIRVAGFGDEIPEFSANNVPVKWADESAVILCQKYEYTMSNNGSMLHTGEKCRKRIIVLDKAALNAFSELYYTKEYPSDVLEIKIVKPDGNVINVDCENEIKVESEIPYFFHTYSIYKTTYYKLAIPNLEVGDIIDYKTERYVKGLLPMVFTLATDYPIVKQVFSFHIGKYAFFNFKSLNGAPEIKLVEVEKEMRKAGNSIHIYEMVDEDRDKIMREDWISQLHEYPYVKLLIHMPYFMKHPEFFDESSKVTSIVSEYDIILKVMADIYIERKNIKLTKDLILSKLNLLNKKETDKIELAKEAYYYYRNIYLKSFDGSLSADDRVNDITFCSSLTQVFRKLDIEYEIVFLKPRYLGSIEDIVFSFEAVIGLWVNEGEGLYLFPFNAFTKPGDVPYIIEENVGIKFEHQNNPRGIDVMQLLIPLSTENQNVCKTITEFSIGSDFNNTYINRTTLISGAFIDKYAEILFDADYCLKEDESYISLNNTTNGDYNIGDENQRIEILENYNDVSYSYNIKEIQEVKLLSSARNEQSDTLAFKEEIILKNFINKAGNSYMVNIGLLIGDQYKISADDSIRSGDIYFDYKRSYLNEIVFTIPDDFELQGAENLNLEFISPSISFRSTAVIKGNKLIVETEKKYKQVSDTRDNWKIYVDCLDVAYKFSQSKVLLKKIETN